MRAPRLLGRAAGAFAALALATAPLLPALTAQPSLDVEVTPGAWPVAAAEFVASARTSVDMAMYELDDPGSERALAGDEARGVRVRVLLDAAYGGRRHNAVAFGWLARHGVAVHWAWPHVILHQKTVVVDGQVAAVMTANLVARDYGDTRDAVVVDRDPLDVAVIERAFASDWSGRPPQVVTGRQGDLVFSPGAQRAVMDVIRGARRTVLVETEELTSRPVEDALAAAAGRGVRVEVVVTAGTLRPAVVDALRLARVRVVERPTTALYLHAKLLVVDAGTGMPSAVALVGSQNLTPAGLDDDRELGVVVRDPATIAILARVVHHDAGS